MTLYLETKALETISEDLAYDNADAEEVAEEIRNGKSEETEQEGNWQGEDPRKLLEQELGIGLLQLVLPSGNLYHKRKYPCRMYHRLHVERKMFRRAWTLLFGY